MRNIPFFLGLVLTMTSCQRGDSPTALSESRAKQLGHACSSTSKVVKVPQEFLTIDEALIKNGSAVATPTSTIASASPDPAIPRLIIQVAYNKEGYLLKSGLTVERPCTDIIGIGENGKKPILQREEFGVDEQPVVKLAASNVLLKGFDIRGRFTTRPDSGPYGVLVLIREDQTEILGYGDISIEENDINNIGYQYPKDPKTCWKKVKEDGETKDKYICGGGHGIEIKSNTSQRIERVTVRGNKFHDLHLGQSEAITISNNVYDFVVEDNEIYDVDNIGIDIAGFQDDQTTLAPSKGKVVSNRVYKSNAKGNPGQLKTYPWIAGIYIDGGRGLDLQDNPILIERNVVYDYGFGIEIGSERSGEKVNYLIVQNNLIFGNWIVGIGVGHNDDDQQSYVEDCLVRNNTLYQDQLNPEPDAGELRLLKHENVEAPLKNIRYENNLIVVSSSNRCLVHAEIKPPPEKFDVTFVGNLFVGASSKFWNCEKDFQQFNSMTEITLQNNEMKSEFPFQKPLPSDPKLIIGAIQTGTIKDYFKPKGFAVGKGITW